MDRHSVFMTAFWAGLAAPGALLVAAPVHAYRPQVADLTIGDSFFFVGTLLTNALCDQDDGRAIATSPPAAEQLSFEFSGS